MLDDGYMKIYNGKEGVMMKDGDWVSGVYEGEKFIGYILNTDTLLQIRTTVPSKFGVIYTNNNDVVLINESTLGIDQLDNLMKIAVKFDDKEWTEEINKEISFWKDASYLDEN